MVSKETNHLVTGQHTNSKTTDKLPGTMTVRSVLLNRDSPDIESRLKRRRNRTQQVRFKDLEDGLGSGTTGAKSYQKTAAECDSPHPFRKNSPTSPMAPQGWLTEASVVGAVRGDMADTIEVVAAFLARAPPHPLTPGPTRRCWAPPPSPPLPCSLTLPLSRRQCTSMAIQTSPRFQKPKPSMLSNVRSVGDSVEVDGDDKQDNEHDEYYTTHNYLSEPASRDGNGPGFKTKQGLVNQTQCLRTSEANASSLAVGNHMDSSWHNSSCFSPPKCQGSATPSQVRRRRRINNAISDPGREVSYCATPTQTESPCVSPPNTPPPLTVQPSTCPPPSTVGPSTSSPPSTVGPSTSTSPPPSTVQACTTQTKADNPSTCPPPSSVGPSTSPPPSTVEPSTSPSPSTVQACTTQTQTDRPSTSPPPSTVGSSTSPSPSAVGPYTYPPPLSVQACTTQTQTDCPSTFPPPSTLRPSISSPPTVPSTSQTQTVLHYASLPKTVLTSTHPRYELPPQVVLPCVSQNESTCTSPPRKSVLPSKAQTTPHHTTQTEPVPPCTSLIQIKPTCTTTTTTKASIPNWPTQSPTSMIDPDTAPSCLDPKQTHVLAPYTAQFCPTPTIAPYSAPSFSTTSTPTPTIAPYSAPTFSTTPTPTPTIAPYSAPTFSTAPTPTPTIAPYSAPTFSTSPNPTPTIAPCSAPTFSTTPTIAPYSAPTCHTNPTIAPCTILTQTAPPCSSLNKAVIYCTSPPPTVTLCHPTTQTVPPYISLIQTIPPGNPPCQTIPPGNAPCQTIPPGNPPCQTIPPGNPPCQTIPPWNLPCQTIPPGNPPCQTIPPGNPPCQTIPPGNPPCQTILPGNPPCQTIPPGNPPCQTIPPCFSQPPVVPSYSAHIQIQTIKYCSSPSPIVKSCNSPPPMVKSYHTLPTGPSCATPTKTVPLYASTFRPAPPYTPPPQAQHCSTQDRRVIEWECRGERRILPPPPPPPPPYTPRKEGVSCTSGPGHRSPLLRRASEKEKSGRSGSPVHCPRACSLKHRAQTPPEVPLKGNQGDQGSSPTKAIPRPTCLGQAQAQLGAQIGVLHKILCSGPNTPNSQHAFPPGQYPSGGCSGSGGGSSVEPLTSIQADTLRQVQEILGGLVSGARSKLDPTWVAEKLMGPNGPLHDIRSLQTQLHSLEGVLETSQNTIKVLLDVIQDLEKKEAERDGRHSYRTGQDIENCGTCRDCACIIYSVEHDFRLQEGAVTRTWRVEDPPEVSLLPTVTPQPTTPHRQETPLPVTLARPPHSGKKSRKKCFWFL
ncbi:mucin-2 [Oncorhynchus kisutch]|uniref:mucin-2 n=1 Tax=Oncorhynchus kisutch TaxID=8019 RepID=UPI0012DBE550|nr:mucin-2 [Oncorhynchus kisutch]